MNYFYFCNSEYNYQRFIALKLPWAKNYNFKGREKLCQYYMKEVMKSKESKDKQHVLLSVTRKNVNRKYGSDVRWLAVSYTRRLLDNSRTNQIADWSLRGLDKSRVGIPIPGSWAFFFQSQNPGIRWFQYIGKAFSAPLC